MKRIELKAIFPNEDNKEEYFVSLGDKNNELIILIPTNKANAHNVLIAKTQEVQARPSLHEVLIKQLKFNKCTLIRCEIYFYKEEIFYCYLVFIKNKKEYKMDLKVTDGISIAIRENKEIVIKKEILISQGILIKNLNFLLT
jgi:bifunctional DNase/RNase